MLQGIAAELFRWMLTSLRKPGSGLLLVLNPISPSLHNLRCFHSNRYGPKLWTRGPKTFGGRRMTPDLTFENEYGSRIPLGIYFKLETN